MTKSCQALGRSSKTAIATKTVIAEVERAEINPLTQDPQLRLSIFTSFINLLTYNRNVQRHARNSFYKCEWDRIPTARESIAGFYLDGMRPIGQGSQIKT